MTSQSPRFKSGIATTEKVFVEQFGAIYEHSPWVASAVWQSGKISGQETVDEMAVLLAGAVNQAKRQRRLELIVAHPDLAGRAAQAGTLTEESTSEQVSAGIEQCNKEEFSRFVDYNDAYKTKFGFPFVMAVKGSNRHLILAAFETRLAHNEATEFDRAISEIHKIAHFRLEELASKTQRALFHSLKRRA